MRRPRGDVQRGARQIGLTLECGANIKSGPEFAAVAVHFLKEPFVARGRFDGAEAFNMHGHPAFHAAVAAAAAAAISPHLPYQSTLRMKWWWGFSFPHVGG